jgi:hypothetical protein
MMPTPTTGTTKPDCIALRGCLGATWCDYCGRPLPVSTAARTRLAALIVELQGLLHGKAAA